MYDDAEAAVDTAGDIEVYQSIVQKLNAIDNVKVINLVGLTYSKKIEEFNTVNFFVANSGTGALVPSLFEEVVGIFHGIVNPFGLRSDNNRLLLRENLRYVINSGDEDKPIAHRPYSLETKNFIESAISLITEKVLRS